MTELGVNLPWFAGAYGHDLGPNRAYPDWPVWYDPAGVDAALDQVAALGVRLARVWLFEEGEGIDISGRMRVDDVFLRNLEDLASRLAARGVRVYWTLFDANSARGRWDRATAPVLTRADTAAEFSSEVLSAVAPLIRETAWAVDLCNEPEAIVAGRSGNGTDWGWRWQDLFPAMAVLRDEVRARAPGVPVSIGSGYHNERNVIEGRYDALDLDFLDFHCYGETIPAPAGRPVVLGEIGRALDAVPVDLGYHAALVWDRARLPNFGKVP
jgi:hypothetical protein